jgi:hypothetical protein
VLLKSEMTLRSTPSMFDMLSNGLPNAGSEKGELATSQDMSKVDLDVAKYVAQQNAVPPVRRRRICRCMSQRSQNCSQQMADPCLFVCFDVNALDVKHALCPASIYAELPVLSMIASI